MEDREIVALYHARSESAIAETAKKYGAFCLRVALNLLGIREDADECVNDTYLAAWTRMPPELPASLRAFLGRITRNLSISRYRQNRAQKRYAGMDALLSELDDCVPSPVTVEQALDSMELTRQIEAANAVNRADEKVRAAYAASRDGIVVLPCYLPWKNGLYKTDALFVVYPSQRGGWSAQCVTDHRTKKPKLPFPASWAGQPQEVIEARSGLAGISFCHASRFLITAADKQTAVAACRLVLKYNGRS